MKNSGSGGFVQGYNAQIAVDADSHVMVAAELTQQENDKQQLIPMVAAVQRNTGQNPEVITADTGYGAAETFAHAALQGVCVLVPPDGGQAKAPSTNRPPMEVAQQMRRVLSQSEGRRAYARRKGSVEPVFGTLKEHRGCRRFLLRGT